MAAAFDFTTLARVKEMLSADYGTSTSNDAFLTSLISSVSTRVEQLMGRKVDAIERTEVYSLSARQQSVELCNWPVSAVSEVKVSISGEFATATAYNSNSYRFDGEDGYLRFGSPPIRSGFGWNVAQVTYTGGMAADASALQTNFADLADAVTRQVVHAFKKRDNPGASSETFRGSDRKFEGAYGLLPDLVSLVATYRRLPIG